MNIEANFFTGCVALKKVFITDMGIGNGSITSSAFSNLTQEIEVHLNVEESFMWKGKIPTNVTVYVPMEYVEAFTQEWLAEDGQIIGKDFSA